VSRTLRFAFHILVTAALLFRHSSPKRSNKVFLAHVDDYLIVSVRRTQTDGVIARFRDTLLVRSTTWGLVEFSTCYKASCVESRLRLRWQANSSKSGFFRGTAICILFSIGRWMEQESPTRSGVILGWEWSDARVSVSVLRCIAENSVFLILYVISIQFNCSEFVLHGDGKHW
jgi:hypothetical protein